MKCEKGCWCFHLKIENLLVKNCKVDVLNLFLPQASFQRSNSHDKVRKIVAEEGRAARNLIAWSVPLENKEEEGLCFYITQIIT